MDTARLDRHLAGCADCRRWREAAAEVTRRARLAPAPRVPDVTTAVLDALPAPARRRWVGAGLRLALLAVGAGQLAVALPALTRGTAAVSAASPHLTHETAAWNLGLAACFVVVAARPRLAAGALPFLLPFTAVLVSVTVRDLGAGHVHVERAGAHLLLVAGAVLVGLLALRGRTARGPAGTRPIRGSAPWPAFPGGRSAARPGAGPVPLRAVGPAAAGQSAATPLAADRAA
jgi:predicted anti-sigma-YlaC factor YlaD